MGICKENYKHLVRFFRHFTYSRKQSIVHALLNKQQIRPHREEVSGFCCNNDSFWGSVKGF
jgi:hypothetical protein